MPLPEPKPRKKLFNPSRISFGSNLFPAAKTSNSFSRAPLKLESIFDLRIVIALAARYEAPHLNRENKAAHRTVMLDKVRTEILTALEKKLTPSEKKRLNAELEPDFMERFEYIPVKELFPDTHYGAKQERFIVESMHRLSEKSLTVDEVGGFAGCHFIRSGWKYYRDSKIIRIAFDEDFLAYVKDLSGEYTLHTVIEFMRLRKTRSQRIYQLINSWRNEAENSDKNAFWYPLDKLHELLQSSDTQKKDYGQFRMRVMDPAKKELEKTQARFNYERVMENGKYLNVMWFYLGSEKIREVEAKTVKRSRKKSLEELLKERNAKALKCKGEKIKALGKTGFEDDLGVFCTESTNSKITCSHCKAMFKEHIKWRGSLF